MALASVLGRISSVEETTPRGRPVRPQRGLSQETGLEDHPPHEDLWKNYGSAAGGIRNHFYRNATRIPLLSKTTQRGSGPGRLTITTKNRHLKPTQPAAEPERNGTQGAGSDLEESRLREKSMATPKSGGERGDNLGQNTPNLKRAISHRRLNEAARRAEIRNQRASLRTVSGETGESFTRLKLKNHSPCGDARTHSRRKSSIKNQCR